MKVVFQLKHTQNAIQTFLKLSFCLPHPKPSQRRPHYTLIGTQPHCSSILAFYQALPSLIPLSDKKPPGHKMPGREIKARRIPPQHRLLCPAKIVSLNDCHHFQLQNVAPLSLIFPQPSPMIPVS